MPDFQEINDFVNGIVQDLDTHGGANSVLGAGELISRLANEGIVPAKDGAESHMVAQAVKALSNAPIEERSSVLLEALSGAHVADLLDRYPEVAVTLIPELAPSVGFDQHSLYHNHDVYGHLVETMRHVPPTVEMRLAALLHDIGKPATFTVDAKGMGHFPGHPAKSVEISQPVFDRLGLSPNTRGLVTTVIRYHDFFMLDQTPKAVADLAEAVRSDPDVAAAGIDVRDVTEIGIMMREADIKAQAPDAPGGGMEGRLAAVAEFRPVAAAALRNLGFDTEAGMDAIDRQSSEDCGEIGDSLEMDGFDSIADPEV